MIPFIHIGRITLASFGLMVGAAMLVSYFIVAKDFARRSINAPADLLVAVPCIAGLIGAKLYHVLEDPRFLLANPHELISQYGFAWFGGFLGGLAAFLWLAHHYRIPFLEVFDAVSPAAALGYGIGRIGCLLSGDGDYGIPTSLPWGMSFPNGTVPTTQRVHPTPIYELIVAIFIFWWLWQLGGRQVRARLAAAELAHARGVKNKIETTPAQIGAFNRRGVVFAQYLILTGLARFLVEFIRINPRSFFGMTNAQTAALASIIAGVALIVYLRGQYTASSASQ